MSIEPWEWPEALDALSAAPEYHILLLEDERVRVLDTIVPPGHTVPLHTHRWPSVLYILGWSDFVRRDADGKVLADSRESPKPSGETAIGSGPLPPHTIENVGESELRAISVEMKNRRSDRDAHILPMDSIPGGV
jgi:hypothetical protein